MLLSECHLGQKIRFFVSLNGQEWMSSAPPQHQLYYIGVECHIIRSDPKDRKKPFMIAVPHTEVSKHGMAMFKLFGRMEKGVNLLGSVVLPPDQKMPSDKECQTYQFVDWPLATSYVEMIVDGADCVGKYCPAPHNQYAQPNQPNGTFLCYSCRQLPSYMR